MLEKCKTALLLSDVDSFVKSYIALADSIEVNIRAENVWDNNYRIHEDIVILGSKYLPFINKAYYENAVIILKTDENPAIYMKEGISHFIFDYTNKYELMTALFVSKRKVIYSNSLTINEIISDKGISRFCVKDYDFDFAKNIYKYKGSCIYLQGAQKKFLAQWLLNGEKNNKRRMIVCNLRKKFGQDFLKDIDRYGQLKGGIKDEQ